MGKSVELMDSKPPCGHTRCRGFAPLRLVLLDLDDTLCDYRSARDRRLRAAFTNGNEPGSDHRLGDDLDRMVAASIAANPHGVEHFPRLFEEFGATDPTRAEQAAEWYRRNRFFGLRLFPESLSVIAWLRSCDSPPLRIGVVTNGPAEIQRTKAMTLGIDRLVDFVLVSGEFGSEKPDRAIFEEALRLGGAPPERAIMVGDSLEHDIAGAQAAGITAVWINRSEYPNIPVVPKPDFVVQRLRELPDVLLRAGEMNARC